MCGDDENGVEEDEDDEEQCPWQQEVAEFNRKFIELSAISAAVTLVQASSDGKMKKAAHQLLSSSPLGNRAVVAGKLAQHFSEKGFAVVVPSDLRQLASFDFCTLVEEMKVKLPSIASVFLQHQADFHHTSVLGQITGGAHQVDIDELAKFAARSSSSSSSSPSWKTISSYLLSAVKALHENVVVPLASFVMRDGYVATDDRSLLIYDDDCDLEPIPHVDHLAPIMQVLLLFQADSELVDCTHILDTGSPCNGLRELDWSTATTDFRFFEPWASHTILNQHHLQVPSGSIVTLCTNMLHRTPKKSFKGLRVGLTISFVPKLFLFKPLHSSRQLYEFNYLAQRYGDKSPQLIHSLKRYKDKWEKLESPQNIRKWKPLLLT